MKNRSLGFYVKLAVFIGLLFISFRYNAFIGNLLISLFVITQLYLSRSVIYAILGNTSYSRGDKSTALNWYKKAIGTRGCKPRTKTTYGYLLLKEGKVDEADKILEEVMKCKLNVKDENQLKLTYALVKWKVGNLDESISLMEEVHKNYRYTTSYESLGYLLILKGNYEEALKFNLEAYDYNSASDVISDNLGETYYYLENYDKAYEIYEKLMSKNPTFAEPYYYYGLIQIRLGRKDEGMAMLEKALTLKESFLSNLTHAKIAETIESLKKPE